MRSAAARRRLGAAGERAAERLLRRAGLVVLARNWRGGGGELDLVALEEDTIVFVEVKTRAARAFRARYGVEDRPFRFDLVTVTGATPRETDAVWERRAHAADWRIA